MTTLHPAELWNRLVVLSEPRVRDVLNASGHRHSLPVFAHDDNLRWLAPNLLFEIGTADQFRESASVTNVSLVFTTRYFVAPTNPGIVMADLADVQWRMMALPCDAQTLADYVVDNGVGAAHLATESGADGVSWKLFAGALTFEFQSSDGQRDPRRSSLVSLTYGYYLDGRSAVDPTLTVQRPT